MSEDKSKNHDSSATHQRVQHSTTLNRRYVQRPEPMLRRELDDDTTATDDSAITECPDTADTADHASTTDSTEDTESHTTSSISSFAKCQAENLRRRQELADKINRERMLAMKSKSTRRGYVAAAPTATPHSAKTIAVVSAQDDALSTQDLSMRGATSSTRELPVCDDVLSAQELPTSTDNISPVRELPMQRAANQRLAQTWPETKAVQHPTAQELKDEAIRKAMRSVATMEASERKAETKRMRRHDRRRMRVHNGKRIALAVACAVAVVGGVGYFVASNMPSVSYGAMAMQSGIDLSGMWVPRDFNLVTSSAGNGNLNVIYAKGDTQFSLTAELSTWDSQTLLSNYVETTWRGYDVVKEQGKTIYICGSNATWVSGGIRYTLEAQSGTLTNKQIKTIAASL